MVALAARLHVCGALYTSLSCSPLCSGGTPSAVRWSDPGLACTSVVRHVDVKNASLPELLVGFDVLFRNDNRKVALSYINVGHKQQVTRDHPYCVQVATVRRSSEHMTPALVLVQCSFAEVLTAREGGRSASKSVVTANVTAVLTATVWVGGDVVANATLAVIHTTETADCTFRFELVALVACLVGGLAVGVCVLFLWPVRAPLHARVVAAVSDATDAVASAAYMCARYATAWLYVVPQRADVGWIVVAGVALCSATAGMRSWHGATPHPSSWDVTAGYLCIASCLGFLATSLLYLWADVPPVITVVTYVEMTCCGVNLFSAVLDACLWLRDEGGVRAVLLRRRWRVLHDRVAVALLAAIVAAALYLVASILGVALNFATYLPPNKGRSTQRWRVHSRFEAPVEVRRGSTNVTMVYKVADALYVVAALLLLSSSVRELRHAGGDGDGDVDGECDGDGDGGSDRRDHGRGGDSGDDKRDPLLSGADAGDHGGGDGGDDGPYTVHRGCVRYWRAVCCCRCRCRHRRVSASVSVALPLKSPLR